MQPNNPNPYYPPRQPTAPSAGTPSVGGGAAPNFSGLPSGGTSWGWIITSILLVALLLGAVIFAFWAFGERQDYKNNSDKKVAAAIKVAEKQTTEENNKKFAEELKNPLKTYVGPESYGSVTVHYPKTWSAYILTGGTSSGAVLDAYFHPDIVPAITSSSDGAPAAIALRVQVLNQSYDQAVGALKAYVDTGTLKAVPYVLPKASGQVGTMFHGQLAQQLTGTEIMIPLRDKTLAITTNTDQYLADFNRYILPNLSFVP